MLLLDRRVPIYPCAPALDGTLTPCRHIGRIVEPIDINSRGGIHDGHHRAFAAHALRMPLPWTRRVHPTHADNFISERSHHISIPRHPESTESETS